MPPERKIEYITMIVNLNDDPKLFDKIKLTPTTYSWTGSAVPVYSEQISYLEKLLPIFQGLRFLEHKRIVKDEIEMLKARIERAEIDDILNG